MMNECKTCKYYKKYYQTHAACQSKHMVVRSARMPVKFFEGFVCSEYKQKDK